MSPRIHRDESGSTLPRAIAGGRALCPPLQLRIQALPDSPARPDPLLRVSQIHSVIGNQASYLSHIAPGGALRGGAGETASSALDRVARGARNGLPRQPDSRLFPREAALD